MVQRKTPLIILALMALAIVISGCTSSPGKSTVANQVGTPTPVATEPPEPTVGPTWVPSPTPRPPPLSLLENPTFDVKINADQPPVSGDPDQQYQLDAQHAVRTDIVTFTVQNTGDATLNNLNITYALELPVSLIDSYSGEQHTTYNTQVSTKTIGTLKPGESSDVKFTSPPYGAMLEANVTISANWDGGSIGLYAATLEPKLQSGAISPQNQRQVMTYGSANN